LKIIVTGATGFIGGRFVKRMFNETDCELYSLERLSSFRVTDQSRYKQLFHDLRAEVPTQLVEQVKDADYIVHLAGDVSGVKSLADPVLTVDTNVTGTFNMLELARKISNLRKFIFISTGEVVGAVPMHHSLDESAPLHPSNPYAASKAAAEALVNAYHVSYGVPTVIIRSMNVFGPKQQQARFIPMTLKSLLNKQVVSCHVGANGVIGSRNWLHVDKFVDAIKRAVDPTYCFQDGGVYHVVGPERNNLEIINSLARAINLTFVVNPIVPGASHDLRYALCDTKLGYDFSHDFEATLAETARWYASHLETLA